MNKDDLLRLLDRPIAFHRCLVPLGGVTGALLLSQLIYWTGKEKSGDGWIFKTQREMEEETGLTRREQEGARRKLKAAGVLKEKRVGLDPTVHFKVDLEVLFDLLFHPAPDGGNRHQEMAETAIRRWRKPPSGDGGKRHHLYTENTLQESTFSSSTPPPLPHATAGKERGKERLIKKSGGQGGPVHFSGVECWTEPDLLIARQLVEQHGQEKVLAAAASCPRPLPTAVRKALAAASAPARFDPYEFMRRGWGGG